METIIRQAATEAGLDGEGENDTLGFALEMLLGRTLGRTVHLATEGTDGENVAFGISRSPEQMPYDREGKQRPRFLCVMVVEKTGRLFVEEIKQRSFDLEDSVKLQVYAY